MYLRAVQSPNRPFTLWINYGISVLGRGLDRAHGFYVTAHVKLILDDSQLAVYTYWIVSIFYLICYQINLINFLKLQTVTEQIICKNQINQIYIKNGTNRFDLRIS